MCVWIPCTHAFKFDLKTKIQFQDKPTAEGWGGGGRNQWQRDTGHPIQPCLEFKEINCKTFMR